MPRTLHSISRDNYIKAVTGLFGSYFRIMLLAVCCGLFNSSWSQTTPAALPIEEFLILKHAENPEITGLLPVEKLISEVQPVIYAENGTVKVFGSDPVCLQSSAAQLASVLQMGLPVENVELITVKINTISDLNTPLNLSSLEGFDSLKYVHVLSEVDAPASALAAYVQNATPQTAVFYSTKRNN
ncbi:hypothetical protein [Flavobacterium silvaticum]|uniref:Uncharacterized protein n=1 Tax=Flavobacterium silvaticum TaxID=1852020 RepID=A0A972FV83_9FLAO|nr:hypothetical protein [Flavobacterium silvaticum]NMH29153.1 hypothetical protein [Flavobacterium silvaticum]